MDKPLSLRQAIKTGQLGAFIDQEERRGVPPVDVAELDETLVVAIKPPRSEDQTSHSASRDGLPGK